MLFIGYRHAGDICNYFFDSLKKIKCIAERIEDIEGPDIDNSVEYAELYEVIYCDSSKQYTWDSLLNRQLDCKFNVLNYNEYEKIINNTIDDSIRYTKKYGNEYKFFYLIKVDSVQGEYPEYHTLRKLKIINNEIICEGEINSCTGINDSADVDSVAVYYILIPSNEILTYKEELVVSETT